MSTMKEIRLLGGRHLNATPSAPSFPLFLSVVAVLRNESDALQQIVRDIASSIQGVVRDYELIIVDNASTDDSLERLKELTGPAGEPNLQVYALTKEVDADTASCVGLENALGDVVVVVDPLLEDIRLVPEMLDRATAGADVVFAANMERPPRTLAYSVAFHVFSAVYRSFSGIDLATEAPQYRVLSRRLINFILRHPQPAIAYRHLPATGGFSKVNLSYSAAPKVRRTKSLGSGIDRGMRLLVSTTRRPMRLVTWLALFGAVTNLAYTVYVIAIALFKAEVAPGWTSLSLQQSGMFLLFSLVLLVLGEYLLNMASMFNGGPGYHVAQEFTSANVSHRDKLNVEENWAMGRTSRRGPVSRAA